VLVQVSDILPFGRASWRRVRLLAGIENVIDRLLAGILSGAKRMTIVDDAEQDLGLINAAKPGLSCGGAVRYGRRCGLQRFCCLTWAGR